MDVGAVGSGSPNLLNPVVRPAVAPGALAATPSQIAALSGDSIATLLQDLASPQIIELLALMEQSRLAQDPMLLEGLLRTAVAAVEIQDLPVAIAAMTELVTLNPERGAQVLNQEAALTPIRGEVKDLLQRLTLNAKAEAEHTLAAASLAIETGALHVARSDRPDPQNILTIAQRLLDAGQHINFVRSAELSQMVSSYYLVPIVDIIAPSAFGRNIMRTKPSRIAPFDGWARLRVAQQRLKAIWRRAPVLVLLLVWVSVGLIGRFISGPLNPTAIEIWATAFLALVVFQFFATVRSRRF
jgi:hypothetical protein